MALIDLIFPTRCPACGRAGPAPCERCRLGLSPAPPLSLGAPLSSIAAAVAYCGPARSIVRAAKFAHHRDALSFAADRVAALRPPGIDLVTWIPTTADRRRSRGVDVAEHIARIVAQQAGRPAMGCLIRLDRDRQTRASRHERLRGPSLVATVDLTGRSVLVIDDVITTGSTMRAAARELARAGAVEVHALAFASTLYDHHQRVGAIPRPPTREVPWTFGSVSAISTTRRRSTP